LVLPISSQARFPEPRLTPADGLSTDVFELVTTFDGQLASKLGGSHEWYSPAFNRFRADRSIPGRGKLLAVYDGSAVSRRNWDGLFRIEGERAMLRSLMTHLNLLEEPGVYVADRYLRKGSEPDFRITAHDDGRRFDVDWHWKGENGFDTHVHLTVRVNSRITAADAKRRGIFVHPTGKVVGILKQSPPGTRPHFGERPYWFGPTLGAARAVTVIERSGGDAIEATRQGRGQSYMTVYRLPRTGLWTWARSITYPGFSHQPYDVWVDCRPARISFLPGRTITLRNGQHARLKFEEYQQANRRGVFAEILAGKTVCLVNGLISPPQFERLVTTLRPL
jgi:hypothetical protein